MILTQFVILVLAIAGVAVLARLVFKWFSDKKAVKNKLEQLLQSGSKNQINSFLNIHQQSLSQEQQKQIRYRIYEIEQEESEIEMKNKFQNIK